MNVHSLSNRSAFILFIPLARDIPLVPKLCLGTHLSSKLCFAPPCAATSSDYPSMTACASRNGDLKSPSSGTARLCRAAEFILRPMTIAVRTADRIGPFVDARQRPKERRFPNRRHASQPDRRPSAVCKPPLLDVLTRFHPSISDSAPRNGDLKSPSFGYGETLSSRRVYLRPSTARLSLALPREDRGSPTLFRAVATALGRRSLFHSEAATP